MASSGLSAGDRTPPECPRRIRQRPRYLDAYEVDLPPSHNFEQSHGGSTRSLIQTRPRMFDLPINRSMDNIHKIGVSPSLRANELYKADPMNMFDMNDKELLRPRTPTPPGSPDSVRYSTPGKTNNKELLELFKLQMATTEEATRRLEEAAIQREQLQAKMQMERERLQAEQQVVLARQQAETIAALARQQAELQAERERRQAERESAHTQALVALAKQNDEAARQTIQLLTEAYQSQSARPSARSSRQSSRRESRQHSPARLSQAVYGTKAEPIEVAIQLSNKLQALDDEMRDHAKFAAPHISSAYQGDRKPIYSIPAQLSQPPPPLDGHGTVTPPPAASSQPQPSLQNHGPSNQDLDDRYGRTWDYVLQEMRDIEKLPPVKDDRTLDDLSVRVQSLVGMLQSQQEKGNHELHASSNVERILDKLPKFRQERFRRQRNYLHAPQHELSLMDLSTFLRMEVRSLRLDPSLRGGPTPGDVGKKSRGRVQESSRAALKKSRGETKDPGGSRGVIQRTVRREDKLPGLDMSDGFLLQSTPDPRSHRDASGPADRQTSSCSSEQEGKSFEFNVETENQPDRDPDHLTISSDLQSPPSSF
ncbi:PREDICTED: uncharacterized protein LOC109647932%2C partial [Xyrichtys novacula]|uniref:PREDICTED: uncharacterized protein LOC109647932, partial n=1 Tax=Xyrichtys novacula TaxID=13765 RepID=A0AAV1HDS4_XYRNO|nr:PREDICTED: uncharacterized protein LOC109647932%2C partial [Xyrichtys novacula]